jgi:hypothetical protein
MSIRLSPPRPKKEPTEEISTSPVAEGATRRQWVIITKDFTGLGWAYQLDLAGEDVVIAVDYQEEDEPKQRKRMEMVGDNWLTVMKLDEALKILKSPNTYWVFAENNFPDVAEKLIAEGHKVFPRSMPLSEEMEHDRDFGVEVAEDAGLTPPPTHEFKDRDAAVDFLESHLDKAYVMKINDNKFNFQTFVPVRKDNYDANESLRLYLRNMDEDPDEFILQERIKIEDGTEVNVELWYQEGEPFMAMVGLEVKRKDTYDVGEMCGCGGDFAFMVPMNCSLVEKTIEKMDPFYKEQKYTGFADVNVIFTKDGIPHFLEVCNRFGYNAHPNMFLALARDTFANIIADWVDGKVEDIPGRFSGEVGCSLTLLIDHPRQGLPIHIDPEYAKKVYLFDGYMPASGELAMTGYSDEIAIAVGSGKDIEAAWKDVSEAVAQDEVVSFPDIKYRFDLASTNYFNSPLLRYNELKKRGLI